VAGSRAIDTVVVHYASALNWDTANDKSFNERARQQAIERYPALAKMTREQRIYSPIALRAILEAYRFSTHYVIDRRGKIYEFVPMRHIAWHAGESRMPETFDPSERKGVNQFSVGIELIATDPRDDPRVLNDLTPGVDSDDLKGPNPGFTLAQYRSLRRLIRQVSGSAGVDLRYIVGHGEIAPDRKKDPGTIFDWSIVRKPDGSPFTRAAKPADQNQLRVITNNACTPAAKPPR
jgi:N-acetyl-anhydromuramyl-L-alanine amidase AmpD